ncbi:MAG: hypothetical protein ABJA34_00270 [Pseudonocardiales bacterium]
MISAALAAMLLPVPVLLLGWAVWPPEFDDDPSSYPTAVMVADVRSSSRAAESAMLSPLPT